MASPRRYLGTVASVQPQKRQVRVALRKGCREAFEQLNTLELEWRDEEMLRCKVDSVRLNGDDAHVTFVAGVTRDNVGRMRGARVVAPESFEPGAAPDFELDDLIDFKVLQEDAVIARVVGVMDTNAGGVLELETTNGARVLVPAIPEVISEIDWDTEQVIVGDLEPYAVGTDEK